MAVAERALQGWIQIDLTADQIRIPYPDTAGGRRHSVAPLAVAQRRLGARAFGDIANDAEDPAAVERDDARFVVLQSAADRQRIFDDRWRIGGGALKSAGEQFRQ